MLAVIALLLIGDTVNGQDQAEVGRLVSQAVDLEKAERFSEAIATYNRAADLAARLFGANHVNVGMLSETSGRLYKRLGQYVEAEKRLEKALAVYEQGTDRGLIATGVNSLEIGRAHV